MTKWVIACLFLYIDSCIKKLNFLTLIYLFRKQQKKAPLPYRFLFGTGTQGTCIETLKCNLIIEKSIKLLSEGEILIIRVKLKIKIGVLQIYILIA